MGKESNVRCRAKSMETPPVPSSTALASSPLVAVTAGPELFPAAASTQAPLAAPVASLLAVPPSQMPCTQVNSEGLMRREINVRCPAKSMEMPSIPSSTSHASSPLAAVTTSPELFPAAVSTQAPVAAPDAPLILVPPSDMPCIRVSSEGLMGRKSNVRCPAKRMATPSVPSSTALASASLVAATAASELFPAAASTQAPLEAPVAPPPFMVSPPSRMPCANVSSEALTGRKSNVRCQAKSMETPSIPFSTALASSPLEAGTATSKLFPAAASTQAPLEEPVASLMVWPPSQMPCANVSSEGSKEDGQNPSKKYDHSGTKRKSRAVIQDEIEAHFENHTSDNGAPSDAISIMPEGRMKDIPADDDGDDERTSKLRSVGQNRVSESLSSSTYMSRLSYERLRKKVEEELREEMEAKLQAQEYEFLAQMVELKELHEKVMAAKDTQLENFNNKLNAQMRVLGEMKEWLAAMLTSQGQPLPPFLMPTPVETEDLAIPTRHDSQSHA